MLHLKKSQLKPKKVVMRAWKIKSYETHRKEIEK